MRFLKTNTAVIITVGPFYDATDGVTIEGALTITNERITLTADTDAGSAPTNILDNVTGATSATDNDLNYITGNDAGMMQMELSAANVNRLGRMYLSITDAANHVPVFHEFMVLPAVIYDTFILGTDTFDVNVTTMAANVITEAAIADNAFANEHFANGALTSVEITSAAGCVVSAIGSDVITAAATASDFGVEIGSAVWDTDATGSQTQGTFGQAIGDPIADTTTIFQSVATDAAGDNIALDVVAVKDETVLIVADTGELQSDWVDAGRLDAILDIIAADVVNIDGSAMIGTNNAALATELAKVPKSDGTSSWNATALGAINNQVVDVLKTDTIAERTNGAPPTTPTFEEAISYLYMMLTAKIDIDSGFKEFHNNAGTIIWKKALSDDASNYVEADGEAGT